MPRILRDRNDRQRLQRQQHHLPYGAMRLRPRGSRTNNERRSLPIHLYRRRHLPKEPLRLRFQRPSQHQNRHIQIQWHWRPILQPRSDRNRRQNLSRRKIQTTLGRRTQLQQSHAFRPFVGNGRRPLRNIWLQRRLLHPPRGQALAPDQSLPNRQLRRTRRLRRPRRSLRLRQTIGKPVRRRARGPRRA